MMNVPFDGWLAVWQGMMEQYALCLTLADQKRAALIVDDAPVVAHVSLQEQRAAEAIDALWKKGQEMLQEVHIDPSEATWHLWIGFDWTEEQKNHMNQVRQQMLDVFSELQAKNDLNRVLLRQALDYVQFSLDLISGTIRDGTYAHPTQIRKTTTSTGRFEWKA